jgi:hypothetical protein
MKKTPSATFAERWAPDLQRHGHTQISNFFLRHYHRLGITHGEAMFIVHLMQYKWDRQAPYPSYATIAERMGVKPKSVQRFAASLQQRGLLWREYAEGQTNTFHLDKLMAALVKLIPKVEEPAQRRRGRKGPVKRQR